jgi:hypothetical protein
MALHPETYKQARKKALLHIQIEIDPIQESVEEFDDRFPISGKIIRIFRGSQICQLGEFINFEIAVWDLRVNPLARVPASGILWLNYSGLLERKYLEVYLNGKPPNFNVALFQYESIDAPTEHPVIPSPPRKWWHKPLWILENLIHKISGCLYEIKWRIYEISYKIRR